MYSCVAFVVGLARPCPANNVFKKFALSVLQHNYSARMIGGSWSRNGGMLTILWGNAFICGDVIGANCGETVFDGVDPELETRDAITSSLPGARDSSSQTSLAHARTDSAQITACTSHCELHV